jgi:hypothetical protein
MAAMVFRLVHAIGGHSNKSALEPPPAVDLDRLAKQVLLTEPRIEHNPLRPMVRNLRRRLSPKVQEAIVSRYAAGESAKALSQQFDISRDEGVGVREDGIKRVIA